MDLAARDDPRSRSASRSRSTPAARAARPRDRVPRLRRGPARAGSRRRPGTIAALRLPQGPGVRNDVGVEAGSVVPIDYDPMLGKLIVHGAGPCRPRSRGWRARSPSTRSPGWRRRCRSSARSSPTRSSCAGRLRRAVARPAARRGRCSPATPRVRDEDVVLAAAGARARRRAGARAGAPLRTRLALARGPARREAAALSAACGAFDLILRGDGEPERAALEVEDRGSWRFTAKRRDAATCRVARLPGRPALAALRRRPADLRPRAARGDGARSRSSTPRSAPRGRSGRAAARPPRARRRRRRRTRARRRSAPSCRAASSRCAVAEGDRVAAGQVLLVLEAMKMQNEIRAAGAGIVPGSRRPGRRSRGALLAASLAVRSSWPRLIRQFKLTERKSPK